MKEKKRKKLEEILGLLKRSLRTKWNEDLYSQTHRIDEECSFCKDARERKVNWNNARKLGDGYKCEEELCEFCLCPKKICANHAANGYVNSFYFLDLKLSTEKGKIAVRNSITHMIELFQKQITRIERKLK